MTIIIDRLPRWDDVRIPFAALLLCYIALGVTVLGFNRSLVQISAVIVFSCFLDMFLHAMFNRGRLLFPLSAFITGASLSILVNYAHGSWYSLVPVFFAISSKYLLTYQGRHIFNPSLIGIVIALLISDGMISASPAYQWGGSIALVVFIVTAALTVFVFKLRRGYLVTYFLVFYFIALAIRAWLTQWHMPMETWFMGALTSPAFYLFVFFMITDPVTSPASRKGQIFMATCIVVFDLLLHKMQVFPTLFYAGAIYYALIFIWNNGRQSVSSLLLHKKAYGQLLHRWAVVMIIGSVALMMHRAGAVSGVIVDPKLYFHELNVEEAGITARPGDLLDRVDSRVQHIGKWILSVGDAVAISDVNGDGYQDFFLTNPLKHEQDRAALYINNGDFQFKRVAMPAFNNLVSDPEKQGVPSGALWFDYDNDGDDDLLILVSFGNPLMLKNHWIEKAVVEFSDVSEQVNLDDYLVSVSANVIDINRDGKLDLLIGNALNPYLDGYETPTKMNIFKLPDAEYDGDRRMFNFMHRSWYDANNGGENYIYMNHDGGFAKIDSHEIGLYETRWSLDIGVGDLNNDGWSDLYIANDFGPDSLYINEQNNHFKKLQGKLVGSLGKDTYKGMNASINDFDNNGYLDIYISNVHEALQAEGSLLWMNNGTSTVLTASDFTDEAVHRNVLNEQRFGWGAAVADIDLDGLLDIVQANGMVDDSYDKKQDVCEDFWYWNANIALTGPDVHGYADRWADLRGRCIFPDEKNRVYLNRGDYFVDVASRVGLDKSGNSRGVALSDLDNDGDLDLMITHQFAPVSIYRNDMNPSNWYGLKLIGNGKTCNKNAYGTRVVALMQGGEKIYREIHASNGFSSQSDSRLIFGSEGTNDVLNLDIHWCGDALPQRVTLSAAQYNTFTQPVP